MKGSHFLVTGRRRRQSTLEEMGLWGTRHDPLRRRITLAVYEAALIERTLEFAHLGTIGSFLAIFDPASQYGDSGSPPPAFIQQLQVELREALGAIVSKELSGERTRGSYERASGVRLSYSKKGELRYEIEGPEMLFAQVLVWLIDKGRHYELSRCQLASCGRFFLVTKPESGRPRRSYCTNEHMIEANQSTAAERVRRSRERRRRAAKHK